ncbi:energy transducer TonB [Pseudomonas brassicacearum]|uniref:Protein TonB n=1 Tax=Pseudomonas brassicacearum TaxID=930166 RepID=A0A423H4W0_9PSED|nr:energy transducer TonB [Pseudomonas brassicacearum]RON08232.1 energy transducer TonB [Pseudomonas brassicacearum]
MRWFMLFFLLVLSGAIRAGEVFLIPENNPKPLYPRALHRAGITGDVRVGFTVHADGSVNKINILQSDHPDLAEATKVAIGQWRFKPWTVEGDKPAELEIIAPMVFLLDAPNGINQWLKELKCSEVNKGLVGTVDYHWIDLAAFHYTRAYLSNGFPQGQLSTEQRLAMIAKLNRRVPSIARQCLEYPASRYMRLLPEEIRRLL